MSSSSEDEAVAAANLLGLGPIRLLGGTNAKFSRKNGGGIRLSEGENGTSLTMNAKGAL
jgi:hypothetical protein